MTKHTRYFLAGSTAVLAAGLCTGLAAYYLGGFQPVSASAVASELRYVPADAAVVAYADVRAIMDSDLRFRLKQALPTPDRGQQEFQERTGIDIERDIDYVVAAATPGAAQPAPLVVARGRFNDTLLESLVREHGGQVEDYKGKRLIVARHQGDGTVPVHARNMVLAFLEPGLIAIGDLAAVQKAIDAQLTAHSITSNNEMMELVKDIEQTNNAWAVGRFDVLASQAKLPAEVSSRLPPLKWFAATGHINGGISGSLRAEALDDKAGEQVRQIVNGFVALARMQAGTDPKAIAMMNSLQVSGSGKTVALNFMVPAEVLELVMPKPAGPQAQQ
jgi:hypothetical protein